MKKIFLLIVAAAMAFAVAAPAWAFTSGELVQYIYEGDTPVGYEFATSIGDVTSGNLTSRTITAGQIATDLSEFDTDVWGDLHVGFTTQYSWTEQGGTLPFQVNTYRNVFFATTSNTASVNFPAFDTFSQNSSGLVNTGMPGQQLKDQPVSYWTQIEGTGMGGYAGFNANPSEGVANLGALAGGIGSFVDMYLYQYLNVSLYDGSTENGFVNLAGDFADGPLAVLRIGLQDDGQGNAQLYSQINPVPVPAAVWLLGSGLLGLIGIRRRKS